MKRIAIPTLVATGIATISVAFAARERTELPTGWHLVAAPALTVATKTLPQSAVHTADGRHLLVVEGGQAAPGIRILASDDLSTERDIAVRGAYGSPLADRSGTGFWVSSAADDTIDHYDAVTGLRDRSIDLPGPFWAAEIARSPGGTILAVSGDLANAVVLIDEARGTPIGGPITVGNHPAGLVFSHDGSALFVANWGASTLSVVDVAAHRHLADIPVGKHPEHLALAADGKRLYVTETDDDTLGIVDLATRTRIGGTNVAPYGGTLVGASPSQFVMAADGKRAYVACSAANAVSVVDLTGHLPRLIGAIPTGWYPTALALTSSGDALDVVDGKGEGGHPNPQFQPFAKRSDRSAENPGYVAASTIGSVRRIPIPGDAALGHGILDVLHAGAPGLFAAATARGSRPLPRGPVIASGGPIHHVIYVIKENRTYDQILGDLPGANGDPSLTLFGEKITPNEHAIARRFGIFDNTYADAQVSADGHNWSMAAYANDYLEKMWPPMYGGRRKIYDFEDGAVASVPHAGFLWNAAIRAHISIRNYGEFTTESLVPGGDVTTSMPDLGPVTDPKFVGFDTDVRDETRVAEWAREFRGYVERGDLPTLEIVRLPNDHTAGTRPGSRTPTAMVAENDGAVGTLVATVSHSRYWASTAIFIVEDDAQNGADHVDAQRMTAYIASPYARGGLAHEHYSTSSVLHTIEILVGLRPMTPYDAGARTLADAFTATPDLRPFEKLPAGTDLDAVNAPTAYRARESAHLDFREADRVPETTLNAIIVGSVTHHASRSK